VQSYNIMAVQHHGHHECDGCVGSKIPPYTNPSTID